MENKYNFYVSSYESDNDWSITTVQGITMDDYCVSQCFNIDIKEYQQILKNFGAYKFKGNYWFKSKEDADKCVSWLRNLYMK